MAQSNRPLSSKRGPPGATAAWTCVRDIKAHNRILYTNPVCLLLTRTESDQTKRNAMVVTWLTPIDNRGHLVMSINRKRHSALALQQEDARFALAVGTAALEPVLLHVGSCSGKEVNKFEVISGLREVSVRLRKGLKNSRRRELQVIEGSAAHLECQVYKVDADVDNDHLLIYSSVTECYVDESYWNGKHFIATDSSLAPHLSFLGSQRFAYVMSEQATSVSAGSSAIGQQPHAKAASPKPQQTQEEGDIAQLTVHGVGSLEDPEKSA